MGVYQYLIPTVKHSPDTVYPNFSRIVNEHGVIEYGFDDNGAYVDDSYGSPDMSYSGWVLCVDESGYVGVRDYVYNSYGSPDPRDSTGVFQYCILQFGDPRAGNYVDFSYGSSPSTDVTAWAYVIFSSGELQNGHSGVAVSYGRRSPFMGYSVHAWYVTSSGNVDNSGNFDSIGNSYGHTSSLRPRVVSLLFLEHILLEFFMV